MGAYYNEHDAQKAAWLRELIRRNVIADGEVDERDIKLVQPEELRGFAQCHFFAGVGVWSYALRLAGWPDDRECWTGSCPCPSFSAAGQGKGFDDARHLWPDWVRLIRIGKPSVIFGEQADDAIGYGWLDLVQTDLEAEAYAVGKAVLGACSVGGSDIRQRLYWMANAKGSDGGLPERDEWTDSESARRGEADGMAYAEHSQRRPEHQEFAEAHRRNGFGRSSDAGRMGHAERTRLEGHAGNGDQSNESRWLGENTPRSTSQTGAACGLANSSEGRRGVLRSASGETGHAESCDQPDRHPAADALKGFWRDADWLLCTDGFWRPVEAGTFPLDHGAPCRLGRLRGYGDAINAEVAKAFIEAAVECRISGG